jgi:hypothetical protein
MRGLRWNWPAWAGLLLSILAFISYFRVFARFPLTRNVPWANFLLFGAAVLLLVAGLKRSFTGTGSLGVKFVSSVLTLLSIAVLDSFCFVIFCGTRQLPASRGAPTWGQKAPDFSLRDTNNNLVSLSALLSAPLESGSSVGAPRGVLLIFYRGYW